MVIINKTKIEVGELTEKGVMIDIWQCPRCLKKHNEILAKKFKSRKIKVRDKNFKYYAECPETKEPILIEDVNWNLFAC